MANSEPTTADLPHAGLLKRFAAMLYDGLLLLSVLAIASALLLPFTGGEAVESNPFLTTYFFLVIFVFYAWFWTHGGQTLGMRAWRLQVRDKRTGGPISVWQALLRFLVAIASWLLLGLGFLWSLIDRERLTWHDRYSETVVVVLPKNK